MQMPLPATTRLCPRRQVAEILTAWTLPSPAACLKRPTQTTVGLVGPQCVRRALVDAPCRWYARLSAAVHINGATPRDSGQPQVREGDVRNCIRTCGCEFRRQRRSAIGDGLIRGCLFSHTLSLVLADSDVARADVATSALRKLRGARLAFPSAR